MRPGEARVRPGAARAAEIAHAGRLVAKLLRDAAATDGAGSATATVLADGGPGEPAQVSAEVGAQAYALLVAAGLVDEHDGAVSSRFRAHLVRELLVFTDPDTEEDEQHPLFLDPLWEAELLVRMMLPERGSQALDVGCGCGVLSLVLAADYDRVLGIDVNPRAIEFSRLNAMLNGIENVEFTHSDMYDGVAGPFDRVVFNSPTNEEGETYRDLLEAGEPILRRFFSGLPGHLAPGGVAEVNMAMNDYPDSAFLDRLAGWLGSGMDADVLVCERAEVEPGHGWERGWLVARPGTGRVRRHEWDYAAEPSTEPLAVTVRALLSGGTEPR